MTTAGAVFAIFLSPIVSALQSHNIPILQVSTEDDLRQIASDMLHILKTKDDTNSSTLKFGTPIFNAYRHITQILKRTTDPPPSPIIDPPSPASAMRVEPSPTQQ